jgi:YVTN family beta-propeller protein
MNSRIVFIDARGWRIVSTLTVPKNPMGLALSPDGDTAYVAVETAVCFIDIRNPLKPTISGKVAAPSPEALLATDDRVFASNALDDSITVISVADMKAIGEIRLGIPSLGRYKGIVPAGMAYDPVEKWLLVAESGINAVGVIDTGKNEAIGHIPAGWMPTRVAISGDRVYVANAGGRGTGPMLRRAIQILGEPPIVHPGSLSTFILPDREEILRQTGNVFAYDGFVPYMRDAPKLPAPIEHVLLIIKGSGTFDEILGDMDMNSAGFPGLARFGMHGRASGGKAQFSVQDAAITPNQHAIAGRWAFSDNFYSDGDAPAEAEIFLESKLPDLATEIAIRHDGDMASAAREPDQSRADRFIEGLNSGKALAALTVLRLPNDSPHEPDPQAGYPYEASYYEDNDLATGRIVEALSHSAWWKNSVVFVTEHDAGGGLDHLNSRRTVLLAAGPYVKKHFVSHLNSDVAGLYRTIAELLKTEPHNLTEATAASLREMFTAEPDFTPYEAIAPDQRIFDRKK